MTSVKPASTAAPFVPKEHSLPLLRQPVQSCRGCHLYRMATQAVLGEIEAAPGASAAHVSVMLLHLEGLPPVLATVHPSSILRTRTDADRHRETAGSIADLKRVRECLSQG